MKRFAALFTRLDQTTSTKAKVAALATYFTEAVDDDKLWAIALMSGRRPKRTVTTARLREWAAEQAGIPLWLFEESYAVVGDLAETISLVLPAPSASSEASLSDWIAEIRAISLLPDEDRKTRVLAAWDRLDTIERFLFNKLITGGFRVGLGQKLMTRALSHATGIDEPDLAHRLMGNWSPDDTSFDALIRAPDPRTDLSRPYPFCLAYPLDTLPEDLGPPADWAAEWKWDGIRGQVILREAEVFVWSRGEELVTDRFPEFARLCDFFPSGTVFDGEILAWQDDRPLPFAQLQRRLGRKTVPKKLLREAPVILRAYDLLEQDGEDLRKAPFAERRRALERLCDKAPPDAPILPSPLISFDDWGALAKVREDARGAQAEGLMLKRVGSAYGVGRTKGDWWKWKVDPLVIDAVMIYAQSGHGRRANLFTDFTFAVWDGDALVPFTKAYSGLTDAEFREITAWVRKNTRERFGPVRAVTPTHVFEIAFEGIRASTRHKSGVALRFPRMNRWRRDKPACEANTLSDLKQMLAAHG